MKLINDSFSTDTMETNKTPSFQSLLDSDLESVDGFQCLNFDLEELDDLEYALPSRDVPTLAEALLEDDEGKTPSPAVKEPTTCLALQEEFLQGVSQQLQQAQNRSSTGAATSISIGPNDKLTVGTAHGHLLTFQEQVLRWVCNLHTDHGAVSCLAYNSQGDRILAGFARGLICQYDSVKGIVLRRVTLSGETWGILRISWAGTTGLALDTGGSVWLLKFARPLGVRSAKSSCLFSGARGEVVAMAALDARILALATLSRVIIVAGGQAAGVRLEGPPDTLPVLTWSETEPRTLICARARRLQWMKVNINDTNISIVVKQRYEMKTAALWLGWIGGSLAIIDTDENLRLCGEDYDKPLDLSHIEPIYASALFKGVWTDGRVSAALRAAGGAALWGACGRGGEVAAVGRRGAVRVRARDVPARVRALSAASHHARALALLTRPSHENVARDLVLDLAERPHLFDDKAIALEAVKLCGRYNFSEELWTVIWERWSAYTEGCEVPSASLAEACGEALARGEAPVPKPDAARVLLTKLADLRPALLERTIAALPLCALDPHAAATLARDKGLWRAYGAVVAAIGGTVAALRELTRHVSLQCPAVPCACAGDALLLASADGLAGRGCGGLTLQEGARPSARHTALHALLHEEDVNGVTISPLLVLALHDAHAATQLLRQCWRHPPFAGPLAKHNRLRVARALLPPQPTDGVDESKLLDIVEFLVEEMESGSIPQSEEVWAAAARCALASECSRAARVLAAACAHLPPARRPDEHTLSQRPRHSAALAALHDELSAAVTLALTVPNPAPADTDDLFRYVTAALAEPAHREHLRTHLTTLTNIRPKQMALILHEHFPDDIDVTLRSAPDDVAADVALTLLENGFLRGDGAFAYFERLCKTDPNGVVKFLNEYPGTVRPEDALDLVRKYGAVEAEAACLEAVGDAAAAVELLTSRMAACGVGEEAEAEARRLADEACRVCVRAARAAPLPVAAAMWARVLPAAPRLPAAVLLQALRALPPAALLAHADVSLCVAGRLLRAARVERSLWACAARVLHRDLHARAVSTRRAGGVAARGEEHCSVCGRALAGAGAGTVHVCVHRSLSVHAACPAPACPTCTPRCPPRPLAPRARRVHPAPLAHDLVLAAPPRPDLEGLV